MSNMVWLYAVGLPLFIVFFSWASLAGTLWLIARASGWAELAAHYGKDFPESSTPRTFRRLGLGRRRPLMYNYAIRARILNRTLYLRPTFLAKSSHKPLAIALADLEFDTDNDAHKTTRTATLTTFPDRKFWFTREDAAWIEAAQGTG